VARHFSLILLPGTYSDFIARCVLPEWFVYRCEEDYTTLWTPVNSYITLTTGQ